MLRRAWNELKWHLIGVREGPSIENYVPDVFLPWMEKRRRLTQEDVGKKLMRVMYDWMPPPYRAYLFDLNDGLFVITRVEDDRVWFGDELTFTGEFQWVVFEEEMANAWRYFCEFRDRMKAWKWLSPPPPPRSHVHWFEFVLT